MRCFLISDSPAGAGAARDEARRRGWTVAGEASGPPRETLGMVAASGAPALVCHRLDTLGAAARDLAPVLRWLEEAQIRLVTLAPPLDTGTAAGLAAAALVVEVGGWEQRPGRPRPGRAAVADRPELGERIAAMRSEGMSLQAIADRLNEEGVPTIRGGARWRPSSVQTASGYRRPGPGGPPPPPPPRGGGHPKPRPRPGRKPGPPGQRP